MKLIFATRYTLPYREETGSLLHQTTEEPIHPPVQGGNYNSQKFEREICDTPSRTGRKRDFRPEHYLRGRYTLPYREETGHSGNSKRRNTIHPPVQGGNKWEHIKELQANDTPSRTGRKRSFCNLNCFNFVIHPPVQGGNGSRHHLAYATADTPSRTGRKPLLLPVPSPSLRYTLPYREEMLRSAVQRS